MINVICHFLTTKFTKRPGIYTFFIMILPAVKLSRTANLDKKTYEIAKQLVDNHYYVPYTHMDQPKEDATKAAKDYYRETQIGGATDTVWKVLTIQKEIKNSKP